MHSMLVWEVSFHLTIRKSPQKISFQSPKSSIIDIPDKHTSFLILAFMSICYISCFAMGTIRAIEKGRCWGGKGKEQSGYECCGCEMVTFFYLELVYFVTALVPSETACFANSPGRIRRTAV